MLTTNWHITYEDRQQYANKMGRSAALIAVVGITVGIFLGRDYLAGVGGKGLIDERPLYQRLQIWMKKSGLLVIFTLSAVPNPVLDVGGMIAGVMGMPAWQFLLACSLVKTIRFILLAMTGQLVG